MKQFNSYGRPIEEIPPVINKGDKVSYLTPKFEFDGKRHITVKVLLEGVWDGEKVQFNDKEQTIIRTTRWLKQK